MVDNTIIESLNSFLEDDDITRKLIILSLHLSMFELINYQVINKPKFFFSNDIRLINGKIISCDETKEYISNVKCHFKKDLYKSSAHWYFLSNIINEEEFSLLIKFRDDRNKTAHEMIDLLFDSKFSIIVDEFFKIADIYKKICLWWVKEVESTTNPIFENINRDIFDFEAVIEPQLFPIKRLLDLLIKIAK